MDYTLFTTTTNTSLAVSFLPSTVKRSHNYLLNSPPNITLFNLKNQKPVAASCIKPSSSLNTPLQPRSEVGKYLSSVAQYQRQLFHVAVAEELKVLADERSDVVSRLFLSFDSDDALLYRRISQLKEKECRTAVEDVMYMLIFYQFSDIRVPLVPKLSKCVYNGRLEIWPSKDWELESIHSFERLEMIKEHVSAVIGLRANSSVNEYWALTEIKQHHLRQVYAASILYGYFLKTASSRHYLDQCLAMPQQDLREGQTTLQYSGSSHGANLVFSHTRKTGLSSCLSSPQKQKRKEFRSYVMGFDAETLQRCAKLRSKEAANLIEKHSRALFENKNGSISNEDTILTSFSSLKRLVLEAVAFGYFLWDAEDYINSVYTLEEN